jgi:hypothetical protein
MGMAGNLHLEGEWRVITTGRAALVPRGLFRFVRRGRLILFD